MRNSQSRAATTRNPQLATGKHRHPTPDTRTIPPFVGISGQAAKAPTGKPDNGYPSTDNRQPTPDMEPLDRITFDPLVMGGKPCIRGMRITVGTIVGMVATGKREEDILELYPYLELEDIRQALSWAAWRAEEVEVPLHPAA